MAPVQLSIGNLSLTVPVRPFTQSAFAPYGDVIQNPRSSLLPPASASDLASLPHSPISANQGTAIKYQNPTRPRNLYADAPSRLREQPAVNIFVCRAHELKKGGREGAGYFPVKLLERHPFTSQTFVPLAASARYLVIVAPTLPASGSDPALPTPRAPDHPGGGMPDLSKLEAFVANGDQGVTYAAGTWHAPMAVIGAGDEKMDFVVVQFMNGVANEDVQEVALQSESAGAGIVAEVNEDGTGNKTQARL